MIESNLTLDLYAELRRIAHALMRRERQGHPLEPTALAHEAYLRLGGTREQPRADFLARAARTMRRVLVDHARRYATKRRGGDWERLELVDAAVLPQPAPFDLVALDDALRQLEKVDRRKGRIVELLFFSGLTVAEAAATLDLSTTTVEDDWYMARAWLRSRLA